MASASRGLIPKNAASKSATPGRKPPTAMSTPVRSVSSRAVRSQSRSSGNPDMASSPASSMRQKASGESAPPGNRQAIDTMAMGSSVPVTAVGGVIDGDVPDSSATTKAARTSGVG